MYYNNNAFESCVMMNAVARRRCLGGKRHYRDAAVTRSGSAGRSRRKSYGRPQIVRRTGRGGNRARRRAHGLRVLLLRMFCCRCRRRCVAPLYHYHRLTDVTEQHNTLSAVGAAPRYTRARTHTQTHSHQAAGISSNQCDVVVLYTWRPPTAVFCKSATVES